MHLDRLLSTLSLLLLAGYDPSPPADPATRTHTSHPLPSRQPSSPLTTRTLPSAIPILPLLCEPPIFFLFPLLAPRPLSPFPFPQTLLSQHGFECCNDPRGPPGALRGCRPGTCGESGWGECGRSEEQSQLMIRPSTGGEELADTKRVRMYRRRNEPGLTHTPPPSRSLSSSSSSPTSGPSLRVRRRG